MTATCGNVCDIVYYILCEECKDQRVCHVNDVDHGKMVDCALKYLVDNRTF